MFPLLTAILDFTANWHNWPASGAIDNRGISQWTAEL
jgi:hypothetical protein